jgi:hypothetical protein
LSGPPAFRDTGAYDRRLAATREVSKTTGLGLGVSVATEVPVE